MTQRGLLNNPMKILSWNCQGLAKPKAVRALRFFLSRNKPDVLFISEVKTLISPSISKALYSVALVNHVIVPPLGLAGGLILAWTNNINLTTIHLNHSFIHSSVSHDPNEPN